MKLDERFTLAPSFKQAHVWRPSNPDGLVRDGFMLTDRLTGISRRHERKQDALLYLESYYADEREIPWARVRSWRVQYHRAGPASITLCDRDGERICDGPLCHGSDRQAALDGVSAWLESVGQPQLAGELVGWPAD